MSTGVAMVLLEVTKVILTRGEDWALVEYRTKEARGSCGGNFGCAVSHIVPGQLYRGALTQKRTRTGTRKTAFKGTPATRTSHALKAALKLQGVHYPDRSAIFAHIKPLSALMYALKHRRHATLMAVPKIGRKKLSRIFAAYDAIAADLQVSEDMSGAFPKLHAYMSKKQTGSALRWMGGSAKKWMAFVRADPWRIVYDSEFDSFPYESTRRSDFLSETKLQSRLKMASAAAADMGLLVSDPRAKRCEAIHALREYMKKTGNYWMPMRHWSHGMVEPTWPIVIDNGHVALTRYADIERFLQKTFRGIMALGPLNIEVELPEDAQLDEHQRKAVAMACEQPLFILQGGAGVGKTTVCKHIVANMHCVCAAPTGKAAQRLAEVTGADAYTVHRLVYMSPENRAALPRHLLLDEQSMQEPEILARLLAMQSFRSIVFVGDIAQLTSVGPGQFFKDICASDIPCVELQTIYRSGPTSLIATNGQKIRHGDTRLETSPESFVVKPFRHDDDIVAEARAIYEATQNMPMVLCNTNAEISNLNKKLRQICNPPASTVSSRPVNMDYGGKTWRYENWRFGVGDSVINIHNHYTDVQDEQGNRVSKKLQVANGEIGVVRQGRGFLVCVKFDTMVMFNLEESDNLRPAYALTVNKAQGSEYDTVIVKSSSSWGDKRERFYTAVTRAKNKCIVYEVRSANDDCIRANPAHRLTRLMKHTLE